MHWFSNFFISWALASEEANGIISETRRPRHRNIFIKQRQWKSSTPQFNVSILSFIEGNRKLSLSHVTCYFYVPFGFSFLNRFLGFGLKVWVRSLRKLPTLREENVSSISFAVPNLKFYNKFYSICYVCYQKSSSEVTGFFYYAPEHLWPRPHENRMLLPKC